MTKKLLLTLVGILGIFSVAMASDMVTRDDKALPASARSMLSRYFKAKVSLIKIDKDFGRVKDYEVILTDGTEVQFDRNGNWQEVEVGAKGAIPSSLYPTAIATYLKTNHKGQRVVGIKKSRSGYELELGNGVEMKFDSYGKFLRYEH